MRGTSSSYRMRQRVQSRKGQSTRAPPLVHIAAQEPCHRRMAKDTCMISRDRQLSFLLDVDNTLLDNDALKELLAAQLRQALGAEGAARFWALYEDVRHERDVVDLPLTVRRYAAETGRQDQADRIDQFLDRLPFEHFLYPHALDTLRHLATLGTVCILSGVHQVCSSRNNVL